MNQPRSHGRHWCKEEAAFLGPEQPQPLHSQIAHWSWLSLLCGWISASQNAIGRPRCSTCNSVLSETSSPFKRMELFFFGWGTPETSSAMLNDVVCFWHIYFRENRWRKQTPQWSHKHVSYMFIYIIKKKTPHETIWKIDHQANLHRFEAYISKPDEWFLKMLEPPAEGNHCPEFLRGIWWMKETWRHAMSDVATRLADLLLQCSWSLDVFRCLLSLHVFHIGFYINIYT